MLCCQMYNIKNWLERRLYFVFGIVWTGFVLIACLADGNSVSKTSFFNIPNKDKIAHFIFYFVFSVVWLQYLVTSCKHRSKNVLAGIIFVLAALVGGMVELMQYYFTSTRSADWMDVLANCSGSLAGIGIGKMISKKRK